MELNSKTERFFLKPLQNYSLGQTFWLWLMIPWALYPAIFIGLISLLAHYQANNTISFIMIISSTYLFVVYLFYLILNCLIKSFYIEAKTKKRVLITFFGALLLISFLVMMFVFYGSASLIPKYLT